MLYNLTTIQTYHLYTVFQGLNEKANLWFWCIASIFQCLCNEFGRHIVSKRVANNLLRMQIHDNS